MISYKYRIYPNKVTEQKLVDALDACRWLYNHLLDNLNDAKDKGIKLTSVDTQNTIPLLKPENPQLGKVYSKTLQMVNNTLWSNIKSLSTLKKNGREIGHLRFKGKDWYKTLNYNQSGFKIDQDHSLLTLSKIGDIKIKLHRPIEGKVKAVLIKKSGNKWYALVQAELDPKIPDPNVKLVGIDVGLEAFAVDTDCNSVENPRFAEKSSDKLKTTQRKLSRSQKGSNRRKRIRNRLDKIHERINNQRSDFLHKLSRLYVNRYDIICIEDLDVKGLKEKGNSKRKHQNIHAASWSRFAFMLSYKAESAGRKLIKVDPRNTSQRCSSCGSIVRKDLSVRVHECPYCGFSCDRDYNASRNILLAGMEQPVAPIESKPLHRISVMQVLAMKWEAASFRAR
ncbi:MAG: transposase [Methanotrichaceae archaeon]|jgi:putative transposase